MVLKPLFHRRHLIALAFAALAGILFFIAFSPKAHSTVAILDTHEHIQSLARAEDLILAMDKLGIEKTVLIPSPIETLTGIGSGTFTGYRENVDEILKIADRHPTRFIPFCTLNPKDKDSFEYLKDCVKRGGKGLKLYNGHSSYYKGFGMALDDPAMEPIYAYADETRLPLLYHVNLDEFGTELEAVLRRHPNLIVSIPHFMVTGSLGHAGRLLDQYPNLYTDTSFGFEPFMVAGFENIGNNLNEFRDFILAHKDRVLFGADMVMTDLDRKDAYYMDAMLGCYKALLSTGSFRCEPITQIFSDKALKLEAQAETCKPKTGKFCRTRILKAETARDNADDSESLKGLNLPIEILDLIYSKNAERFLSGGQ